MSGFTHKIKLNRWEVIINNSLLNNYTMNEARKTLSLLNKEALGYEFTKGNGDITNIVNILGVKEGNTINNECASKSVNKPVIDFYKNIKVEIDKEKIVTRTRNGKKAKEFVYFTKLSEEDLLKREKILWLNINKHILTSQNSYFQKIKNKIIEKYPTGFTNGSNREIAANGRSNTAAAKVIFYKGNNHVLTYERFLFEDFYNEDFSLKSFEIIVKNINNRLNKINLINLYEEIETNFKEKIVKEVFKYKHNFLLNELIKQNISGE